MKIEQFQMNMAKFSICILLSISFFVGCKKPDSSTSAIPDSSTYGTESSIIVDKFLNNLSTDLQAAGYSESQINIIKTNAKLQIYEDKVDSTTDLSLVAPCIVKGAQLSLTKASIGLSTSDEKLAAIEVIVASITNSLNGNITSSSTSIASQPSIGDSPNQPLYATTSSASYSQVLKQIIATSIMYLDEAGIESVGMIAAVKAIVKKISCNLTKAGVNSSEMASVAKSIATAAVGALDDAGISSSDMSDAINAVTSGALTGLKEDGQSSTSIAAISDEITEGTILGLKGAGVSDSDIDSMVETIKTGVNEGLAEAGLSTQEINDVQTTIDEAANLGKRGLSLKSFLSFKFLASNNSALTDDVTGTIDEANKTISLTVPYGTIVTALVVTYTATGESVKIEDIVQVSGNTVNDFSSSLTLTVVAPGGTTAEYTVTVTPFEHELLVSSVSPTANATGVDPSSDIVIIFNQTIDSSSVNSSTVYLKDEANTLISGSMTVNGMVITFNPTNNLIYYTYSLTVTTGLKDTMDIGLSENYSSDFTILWKLPDTGKTISHTDTFGEDHDYTINPPDYTNNFDGTITDNNTNLMWQQVDNDATSDWQSAVDYCNNMTLTGYTDWRLPSELEILSIYIQQSNPSIDGVFTGANEEHHWSESVDPTDNNNALTMAFNNLSTYGYSYPKTNTKLVRCVRGKRQMENLTDNGDNTITDNNTGLIWQKWENAVLAFEDALTLCEGLTLGGQSDWRMPNIKELYSIVNFSSSPAINTTYFPNALGGIQYRTSNKFGTAFNFISFSNGAHGTNLSDSGYYRCVRGGQ